MAIEPTTAVGCRNVKEPIQIHGLGADLGKGHESLSSQQWFAQSRRMRKGVGHDAV